MTARRLALSVMAIGLFAAPQAAAQSAGASPADVPSTPKAAAQESYARGNHLNELAERKHDRALYQAAYLQYSQAYAIYPDDKILWNMLVIELKTRRYVDGLKHLHDYDRRPHGADPFRHQQPFDLLLDEAMKATGHAVISAPSGAHVRLDGADVGVAPLADPVDVVPGPHSVEATLTRGETLTATTAPGAGEQVTVTLAESASEPAAVVATGAPTPRPAAAEPPPGSTEPSSSWWTSRHTLGVGAAVVAVAGVALGTGFLVASSNDSNDAGSQRASIAPRQCLASAASAACSNLQDKINAADTDATLALVSYIVGGLAAAASVGVFVAGGSSSPKASAGSVTWTPVVGLNSVGVAGHF